MNEHQDIDQISSQSKYQVRFDVGQNGLVRLGMADVVIIADTFSSYDQKLDQVPANHIAFSTFPTRTSVAKWAYQLQVSRGERTSIAVIAWASPHTFPAHNILAGGAVINALEALGIDFTSPEAAVASEAFQGLKQAVIHLAVASTEGQRYTLVHGREATRAAVRLDTSDLVDIRK